MTEYAVRLAYSSRALSANLRISSTRFSPLRRSLPLTSASIIGKSLFCSRSHRRISVLSTNSSKSQFTTKSSMAGTVTGKSKGKVEVFDSEQQLAVSLAKYIADLSEKFCKERGSFSVVVSGGSLIKSLRKLVEPPYIDSIDWSKWCVFWVDERVVPKDHPDSNYLLAYDAFLSKTMTGKSKGKVEVFDSEEELAVSLVKYTTDLSEKFCKERGSFSVVISGGSHIKSLSFWVDERVVPKDHPDSNYLLAYDAFLSKIPIPSGNVYAINDAISAEGATDDYETCLRHLVKSKIVDISEATGFPKFDVMLLGMGPDGHVASLFPEHPLVHEKEKWVTFIKESPKPPPERITFTFPVINSSANIALVVAGAGKANVVHKSLCDSESSDLLPVQMVSPEGELVWFLDKAAASKLQG
uniref:Probable 6-phosphogluconolactonase 4, chloroplastic n=1 Tax=Nicotiana sylvestris TaxID=4096 RepID=A0A1U7Y836_NICSY|nr:PREDICTED: probable 6-phosphogluconolactonase 4, chloroplastic [Nicotiana sylvestris]